MHWLRFSLWFLISLVALSGCAQALPPLPKTTLPHSTTQCPEPRSLPGQQRACPMNYLPVCGLHTDGSRSTYSNACSACANPNIIGYTDALCP